LPERSATAPNRRDAPPVAASDTARPHLADPSSALAPAPPPALAERIDGMILVPEGPFMMGADDGGEPDERPAHQVVLAAFYLDETEVTNEAYARAVEAGICQPPYPESAKANQFGSDKRFRAPRQPVSAISWDNARAYCHWLGKRLPSEAEWEKAARGTDGRRFAWGNDEPTPARAQFRASVTAEVATHPDGVGPFGHHDLTGNVWEWVEDVYDPYAYQRAGAATGQQSTCEAALAAFEDLRQKKLEGYTGSNPIPTECERVLRGGAFNYPATGLRASNRVHHPGRYRLVMSGFRCARDP
jgi:serine/threonine-protein kinase